MRTLDMHSVYVQKCFDANVVGNALESVYDGIEFVGHICNVNGEKVLLKY